MKIIQNAGTFYWIDKYNSHRPHGSLRGKTPLEYEIEYYKISDIYQKKEEVK